MIDYFYIKTSVSPAIMLDPTLDCLTPAASLWLGAWLGLYKAGSMNADEKQLRLYLSLLAAFTLDVKPSDG